MFVIDLLIYIYIKIFNFFYLVECFMLNKGKIVREYNLLDYFGCVIM